uniref:Uncharacterized protein n=1 Tax=Rhizophora mucronata TaxID=61149 RepID=A0A2P2PNX5_RHIMU
MNVQRNQCMILKKLWQNLMSIAFQLCSSSR